MNFKKIAAAALSAMLAVNAAAFTVFADKTTEYKTIDKQRVYAKGQYVNWDGVTTVAQFVGTNGELSFAYVDGKNVVVVNTKGGKTLKKRIKLKMQHDIFGTVTCDKKGNYYVVTGQTNKGSDTSVNTIFISKYDKNGNHIKTVGDNGRSSLKDYYENHFCTKIPFDAGCCDAAVNGNILSVNYAREMYSGHQSNSVFTINTDTMQLIRMPGLYESHSFAQRVIPYKDGFVYLSEGDHYERAFSVAVAPTTKLRLEKQKVTETDSYYNSRGALVTRTRTTTLQPESVEDQPIFHFANNVSSSNNNFNFAHAGGIVNIEDRKIAMVGTSAKSLNSKAEKENEQLFIQIFDPSADLTKASAYVTSGTRSGEQYGKEVTDYGVKWLTDYSKKTEISEPQIALTNKNRIVVLYEKSVSDKYKGVYYMVLDENGRILKDETRFSATARLNSCEMPVFAKGKVWWVGNTVSDTKNIYIFSLELE